jgi:hypothetical protein
MKKHISKLTIICVFTLCFLGCDFSDNEICKYANLYSSNSSIVPTISSGVYNSEFLDLEFKGAGATNMIYVYNKDTVEIAGSTIGLKIGLDELKVSLIPSAAKVYRQYSNTWHSPKGKLSSFHSVKVFQYNEGILIDSITCSYILGSSSKDELPVVSLSVEEEFLFSQDSGSYVPGKSFNPDDEYNSGNYYLFKRRKQPVDIQILDSANEYLNDNLFFRTHGYITPVAPQKSLRFYNNGNRELSDLLGVNHELDKFILRSSYSGWQSEVFVDGWIADVCENLNLDVMAYRPAKVYLNKEYWGIHGLRERLDIKAIASKYGVKSKKIIDADDKGYSYKDGSFGDLNTMLKEIKSDSTFSFKNIKKSFKMKSLVDWVVVELFFQNTDWPCNNTFFWKKTKKSGVWRAVLIDMDASVGNPKNNMFEYATKDRSPSLGGVLVTYLLNHPDFQYLFKERVAYLFDNELSKQVLKQKLTYYKLLFAPAIEEHYNRWNPDGGLSEYEKALSRLDNFCEHRHEYFIENMKAYFMEE